MIVIIILTLSTYEKFKHVDLLKIMPAESMCFKFILKIVSHLIWKKYYIFSIFRKTFMACQYHN